MTFLAHGWHLGYTGEPLINESTEAWKFGPVIPRVYFAFQGFGKNPITEPYSYGFESLSSHIASTESEQDTISKVTKGLLNGVYQQYSKYTAAQLSTLTHQPGSPWDQVTKRYLSKGLEIPRSLVISDGVIKDYYRQKVEVNNARGNDQRRTPPSR